VRQQARHGLLIFFIFLLPLTALFDGLLFVTQHITILFLLNVFFVMWTPALAAFAARLVAREGFSDLSLSIRKHAIRKAMLVALLRRLEHHHRRRASTPSRKVWIPLSGQANPAFWLRQQWSWL
jgi:hypothetical protein